MADLKKILFLNLLLALTIPCYAQHENDEGHNKKGRGIYELISSGIYSYSPEHKEGVAGAEVHFTYWFNHIWGTGFSYTSKFEESEVLNEIALLGSWNPVKWMTINVGPNIVLPSEHEDYSLGLYFESEINIRPNEWFHFGPVVGLVYGNALELNAGMHVGFEF